MPRKGGVPVKGSAQADEDLSLSVLINRMKQLESTIRLQELEMQRLRSDVGNVQALYEQALKEKQEAETGLKAALEQLRLLQEARPVDLPTRQMVEDAIRAEAEASLRDHIARTEQAIRESGFAEIENHYGVPVELSINGVRITVPPGKQRIPKLFQQLWEERESAIREAAERNKLIADKEVPVVVLDSWRMGK